MKLLTCGEMLDAHCCYSKEVTDHYSFQLITSDSDESSALESLREPWRTCTGGDTS